MSRTVNARLLLASLILLAAVVFLLVMVLGAADLSLLDSLKGFLYLSGLSGEEVGEQSASIIVQSRFPRALLALVIGGLLAVSGVAMQGLFRNPLADPGLIGVSGGAALGAAVVIVLFSREESVFLPVQVQPYILSAAAFLGGICATWVVYRIGRYRSRTHVGVMLLAGIALTTLAGALIGLLTYISDAAALRSLIFWNLGSLSGAGYTEIWPLLLVACAVGVILFFHADALNALLLGESEAYHLGFRVERLKRNLMLCTALGVGAAVAVVGMIGFIGLMVPHLMRFFSGPNHRVLLPSAALGGGILLLTADLASCLLIAPAELPVGLITTLLGAPFFLYLLIRGNT